MTIYEYQNKDTSVNLTQIHLDVASSALTDKTIEWCRWDESTKCLRIIFTNELTSEDKAILDQIVTDNS
jgi:hypothetical protein